METQVTTTTEHSENNERHPLFDLQHKVIGHAMKVHTKLGPGLYEQAYNECLFYELSKAGLKVEKKKPLSVKYEDMEFECSYKMDLVIEDQILLEVKSVSNLNDLHYSQMRTYLKISDKNMGLVINFNTSSLKDGIRRVYRNMKYNA